MRSRLLMIALLGALLLAACGPLSARRATQTTTPVTESATTTPAVTTPSTTSVISTTAPEEISTDVDLADVDAALADLDQLIGELDSSLAKDEGDVTP